MLLFNLLFLAAVGLAFARGGAPERATASLFCAARLATFFTLHSYAVRFHAVEVGVLIVDVGTFVGLLFVALSTDRFWPMPVAAMQGVSILAHVAELYGRDLVPAVYMNAVQLWAYPELAVLLIGATRADFRNHGPFTLRGRLGAWPARPDRSASVYISAATDP